MVTKASVGDGALVQAGPDGEPLWFPNDISYRGQLFVPGSSSHPAKMNLHLLEWLITRYTRPGDVIADPMGGSGSLLLATSIQRGVIIREIEPRWEEICRKNAIHITQGRLITADVDISIADARDPWGFEADHIIFSPPYSCAMGSTVAAKGFLSYVEKRGGGKYSDRWRSLLERLDAQKGSGASLIFHYGKADGQIGHLRGEAYWREMKRIYSQALPALRATGYMIVVIKDHIKRGERVPVADRTVAVCEHGGFKLHRRHTRRVWPLSLWQRRRKEQGLPVIEVEDILVFIKEQTL